MRDAKNDLPKQRFIRSNTLIIVFLILFFGAIGLGWFIYSGGIPATPVEEPSQVFSFNSIVGEPVQAEFLDVSGCVLEPRIIKISLVAPLKFRNLSSMPVDIVVGFGNPLVVYAIPPGEIKELRINFEDGKGKYPYQCFTAGNPQGARGLFYVE